jgi:hypothetical protein
MDTISFGRSGNAKRILISGFDPFGLDFPSYGETSSSKPFGAAAELRWTGTWYEARVSIDPRDASAWDRSLPLALNDP